jgi:hypothetical protein
MTLVMDRRRNEPVHEINTEDTDLTVVASTATGTADALGARDVLATVERDRLLRGSPRGSMSSSWPTAS